MIDGHPVTANYIDPPEQPRQQIVTEKFGKWIAQQVRQSQYMVQVVKCSKDSCCSPFRSNYMKFFPAKFLLAPIALSESEEGLAAKDDGHYHPVFISMHLNQVLNPIYYDQYYPSVQIEDRKG